MQLTVSGQPVSLNRKPLEILQVLLERPGEVVAKDELVAHVWRGRNTEDSNVTKTLARLREALKDEDHSLIATVHRYGYRLTVPVRVEIASRAAPKLALTVGDHLPLRPQWRLVERLGDGGQGELWLALNEQTGEKRACKFALDGASLSSLKREFTLNRWLAASLPEQALAFVRVLDSNLDQAPFYLAIEYLPAGSLSQWVERQGGCAQIPLEVRLDLAAQIAEALGHAHSLGLLHKDLKPGNVLIDSVIPTNEIAGRESLSPKASVGAVRIKLCDFGSGDLLDRSRLADSGFAALGFTAAGLDEAAGGTPMYRAPEVLGGQPYTIQADLYSFGVLLYQLIAGDLQKALAPGWERGIADDLLREDISGLVDGDLEHRVRDAADIGRRLRNLDQRRKERERQQQKEQSDERLRRELSVLRVRRMWWLGLTAVIGTFLLVVVFLLLEADNARDEALAQNRRAESEAANAKTVNEFLLEDLIGQASPLDSGRIDLRVREVLDRASATAGHRFAKLPDRERAIRLTVGKAYLQLGNYLLAEKELTAALALTPDSEPQQRAVIEFQLGVLLRYVDRMDEARMATLRAAQSGDPEIRLMAAATLAFYKSIADDQDATAVQELLALRPQFEATLGNTHRGMDWLLEGLTGAYAANGQYKEAAEVAREHAARLRERFGEDDPRGIHAQSNLGAALVYSEQFDEAVQVLQPLLLRARTALGGGHPDVLLTARYLADAYSELSRVDEAVALLEPTVETLRAQYGDAHSDTFRVQNDLALLYGQRGDFRRQISMLEKLLGTAKIKFGESDDETLTVASNLGLAYADVGNFAKAEAILKIALDAARTSRPDHWQVGEIAASRAAMLGQLSRFDEAEALYEEAIPHLTRTLGENHSRVANAIKKRDAMRRRSNAGA